MNWHSFFLKFKSPKIHKEYRLFFIREILPYIRLGALTSNFAFLISTILIYRVYPEFLTQFLIIVLLILTPVYGLTVYVTMSEKWKHLSENMSVLSIICGTVSLVYISYHLIRNDPLATWGITICAFYPFLVFRIHFSKAVLTCLIYIGYYILLLCNSGRTGREIFQFSFQIILVFHIAMVCGYMVEMMMRKLFAQTKIIEKRQQELEEEKQRSEKLLLNILPHTIARQLKNGGISHANSFENATILFADIVDFTELSEKLHPAKLVHMLNSIFSEFDDLTDKYKLEKIATVGDRYVVGGGLPEYQDAHAEAVASMAIDMLLSLQKYNEYNNSELQIRIGFHSGPVIAGIIGKNRLNYDLFGKTINIASRMESHGTPGKIQLTESTYKMINNKFIFEKRGTIAIKGIGNINTYYLVSHISSSL